MNRLELLVLSRLDNQVQLGTNENWFKRLTLTRWAQAYEGCSRELFWPKFLETHTISIHPQPMSFGVILAIWRHFIG